MTSNTDEAKQERPVPSLADELRKAEYEPLLPIEKRLIAYSLGIGVLLLGVLVWTSRTMFDGSQPAPTPGAQHGQSPR